MITKYTLIPILLSLKHKAKSSGKLAKELMMKSTTFQHHIKRAVQLELVKEEHWFDNKSYFGISKQGIQFLRNLKVDVNDVAEERKEPLYICEGCADKMISKKEYIKHEGLCKECWKRRKWKRGDA